MGDPLVTLADEVARRTPAHASPHIAGARAPRTALKTLDVLRKGVAYSLPPLRTAARPGARRTTESPHHES